MSRRWLSFRRPGRITILVLLWSVTMLSGFVALGETADAQSYWGRWCNWSNIVWGRRDCANYINGAQQTSDRAPYHNTFVPNGNVTGVFDVNTYTNEVQTRLYSSDVMDRVSAMTMVNVMLGKPGSYFNNDRSAAVTYARNNFATWKQLVQSYDASGRINWNYYFTTSDPYMQSSYDIDSNDYFHYTINSTTLRTVRFLVPTASGDREFKFEYLCGNILNEGGLTPLTAYSYTPAVVNDPGNPAPLPSNGNSTSSASAIYPGQTLKFDLTVQNTGPYAGQKSRLQGKVFVLDPSSGQTYYYNDAGCGGSCYNSPDKSTSPQKGIVSSTGAGIIYNSANTYNVPVLSVGQTFTGPSDGVISSPRSMSYVVPSDAPVGRKICFYASADPADGNGAVKSSNFGANCFIVQAPITAMCSAATASPAAIDKGTAYTISAKIRYDTVTEANKVLAQPDTRFFVRIIGPGVNQTLNDVKPITSDGSGGLSITTPVQSPTNQNGQYLIGYGISGSVGAINCGLSMPGNNNPPSFLVADRPYFVVNDGDVSAGPGMNVNGGGCAAGGVAANDKAGIVSWNRGAAGNYAGAGADNAVLARGHILDFASGRGSALAPTGTSFANAGGDTGQVDVNGGYFGAGFDGAGCTTDYFQDVDSSKIQTGNVTVAGTTIPNCTGTNDTLCRRVMYVKGNVYITGNITFSGSYATTSEIPAFSIVASGNIYIAPNVTRLDGFYIAQPTSGSSTDGVIYTCAPSATIAATLDNNLPTVCGNALTVNGAFVARQIWLLRTTGTVSSTPAETFNYVPELWLSEPFGNGLESIKAQEYDAISNMAPTL